MALYITTPASVQRAREAWRSGRSGKFVQVAPPLKTRIRKGFEIGVQKVRSCDQIKVGNAYIILLERCKKQIRYASRRASVAEQNVHVQEDQDDAGVDVFEGRVESPATNTN